MNTQTITRLRAMILAITLSFWALPGAAEGDAELGKQLGFTCMGCHGIEGQRNAYPSFRVPRIGGQNADYLVTALKAYRDGNRPHPTMQAQASSITDADIDNLVAWIATYGKAEKVATAEQVAGVAAAGICVTCHGVAGENVQPAPPTLAGQHEDYLVYALNEYRNGSRTGNVMTAFAATLSDADIEMLAEFYASQDGVETLD